MQIVPEEPGLPFDLGTDFLEVLTVVVAAVGCGAFCASALALLNFSRFISILLASAGALQSLVLCLKDPQLKHTNLGVLEGFEVGAVKE